MGATKWYILEYFAEQMSVWRVVILADLES